MRATRIGLTAAILAVPLLGLILLLQRPSLDVRWEHHPAHFWLVLVTAFLSAILAYATGEAAGRRGDARLLYVSLAFLSSAGFLALHALATPGVLLGKSNTGFTIATPVGVAIGSVFAALSTRDLSGDSAVRNVRLGKRLRLALVGLMVVWGVWSVAGLPPLNRPPQFVEGWPLGLAVPARAALRMERGALHPTVASPSLTAAVGGAVGVHTPGGVDDRYCFRAQLASFVVGVACAASCSIRPRGRERTGILARGKVR